MTGLPWYFIYPVIQSGEGAFNCLTPGPSTRLLVMESPQTGPPGSERSASGRRQIFCFAITCHAGASQNNSTGCCVASSHWTVALKTAWVRFPASIPFALPLPIFRGHLRNPLQACVFFQKTSSFPQVTPPPLFNISVTLGHVPCAAVPNEVAFPPKSSPAIRRGASLIKRD